MQAVCQLAAVECFYHNTTKLKKEDTVLWWDTCTELWVESSGIVKMGVDLDDVEVVILDEADRLMDLGFVDEVGFLLVIDG